MLKSINSGLNSLLTCSSNWICNSLVIGIFTCDHDRGGIANPLVKVGVLYEFARGKPEGEIHIPTDTY
jgi:hypothetical protein